MSLDEKPNFSRRSSPEKRRKSRDENCAKSLWREAIARDWSAPEHKGIGSISLIISWLSVACRIHEPLHIWGSAVDRMRKSTRLCTQSLVLCMCIKYLTSKASKATSMFYHAAVTEPLVRDFIVVEVSSPTAKKVPVQSYNSFLDQRSRKVVWFYRNHFCSVGEPLQNEHCAGTLRSFVVRSFLWRQQHNLWLVPVSDPALQWSDGQWWRRVLLFALRGLIVIYVLLQSPQSSFCGKITSCGIYLNSALLLFYPPSSERKMFLFSSCHQKEVGGMELKTPPKFCGKRVSRGNVVGSRDDDAPAIRLRCIHHRTSWPSRVVFSRVLNMLKNWDVLIRRCAPEDTWSCFPASHIQARWSCLRRI